MSEEKSLVVQKREMNYLQIWDFIEKSHQTLSKSRAVGKTPEQVALVMLTGYELGLSFTGALRVIYVGQNGEITLKPKGALSLMRSSGLLEKFDYAGDDTQQTVTIKRKGQPERKMSLTIQQAQKAGWKSTAWTATPANMLRWRLIGWLADLEFTDVTLGMPIADDSWMDIEITADGEVIEIVAQEVESDIPDYGYTLQTLLETVSNEDVLSVMNDRLPATPEDINLAVHRLIKAGKIASEETDKRVEMKMAKAKDDDNIPNT